MRQASRPLALFTAAALLAQALPAAAQPLGQPVGKPEPLPPAGTEPLVEQPDPPGLVGRLARLQGQASYRLPGQEEWQPAQLNFPVSTGHALWTDTEARAAVQLGEARLALEANTRLDFTRVAEDGVELSLAEGTLYVALPQRGPDVPLRLATPRGDALLARPGRFLVQAGAEDRPTRIVALAGSAAFSAEGLEPQSIGPGEALAITGLNPPVVQAEPAGPAAPLVAWAQGQEPRQPLPPAVAGMTGADDLSHYGQWQRSEEYGDIWLPPVAADWVPYRDGRWAWVAPWGWTWIDDAPWGFAPFHYGRWVEWNGGWGWAPGAYGPGYWPLYAPALVAFFPGIRPGWLGWAPLRPWAAYHPPYWVSPDWFRRLNHGQVRNLAAAEAYWRAHRQGLPPGGFAPRGATLVPQAVLTGSRPVAPAAQPMGAPHQGLVTAHPGIGPLAATLGGLAVAGALAHRTLAPRPGLPPAGAPRPGPRTAALPPSAAAPPRPAAPPPSAMAPRPGPAPGFSGKPGPAPFAGRPPAAPAPSMPGKPGGWGGPPPSGGYATNKPGGGWGGAPPGHYGAPSHPGTAPSRPSYTPPSAPRYAAPSTPQPHYQAPAPRYSAPAPHFSAPSRPSAPVPSAPPSRGNQHHHR